MKALTEITSEYTANRRNYPTNDTSFCEYTVNDTLSLELVLSEVSVSDVRNKNPRHTKNPADKLPSNQVRIESPNDNLYLGQTAPNLREVRNTILDYQVGLGEPSSRIKQNQEVDYKTDFEGMIFDLNFVERLGLQEVDAFGKVKTPFESSKELRDGVTYRAIYKREGEDKIRTAYVKLGAGGLEFDPRGPRQPREITIGLPLSRDEGEQRIMHIPSKMFELDTQTYNAIQYKN